MWCLRKQEIKFECRCISSININLRPGSCGGGADERRTASQGSKLQGAEAHSLSCWPWPIRFQAATGRLRQGGPQGGDKG